MEACVIWGTTLWVASRYWGKQTTSVSAAGVRGDIQTQDIQNGKHTCKPPSPVIRHFQDVGLSYTDLHFSHLTNIGDIYTRILLFAYRIINNTIAQKQINTDNTKNIFDSSATDTSMAVMATIIVILWHLTVGSET
jgi:hypothetical protein